MTTNERFRALFPSGFFNDFLGQCEAWRLETPLPFMWLTIASAMSSMIGFSAYKQHSNPHRTYPVLSSLLLSPSGICRRGGGTGIAVDIAMMAGTNVYDGAITPEGIIDALVDADQREDSPEYGARLMVYVEEMADVFSKKQSQQHLVSKLTALLNRSRSYTDRTRTGGTKVVRRPCLNLVATSAPTWFVESMQNDVMSGGWMSRIVGCNLDDRDVIYTNLMPLNANVDIVMHSVSDNLKECVATAHGDYELTPDDNVWWQRWYEQNERELRELTDERQRDVGVRHHENALKIAMLIATSHGTMDLKREYIEQGIAIMEFFKPTMGVFFGHIEQLKTVQGRGEKRIVKVLEVAKGNGNEEGWMLHSPFSRGVTSAFEGSGVAGLKACMQSLVERGVVEYRPKVGTMEPWAVGGWPAKAWRLK